MSEKITMTDGKLTVPDNPQIPFISGDGIGPEIWAAAKEVFDAAIKKAYAGQKDVDWIPLLAGQIAFDQTGQWLPDETLETLKENLVFLITICSRNLWCNAVLSRNGLFGFD